MSKQDIKPKCYKGQINYNMNISLRTTIKNTISNGINTMQKDVLVRQPSKMHLIIMERTSTDQQINIKFDLIVM